MNKEVQDQAQSLARMKSSEAETIHAIQIKTRRCWIVILTEAESLWSRRVAQKECLKRRTLTNNIRSTRNEALFHSGRTHGCDSPFKAGMIHLAPDQKQRNFFVLK
jgi:hypothetical protein